MKNNKNNKQIFKNGPPFTIPKSVFEISAKPESTSVMSARVEPTSAILVNPEEIDNKLDRLAGENRELIGEKCAQLFDLHELNKEIKEQRAILEALENKLPVVMRNLATTQREIRENNNHMSDLLKIQDAYAEQINDLESPQSMQLESDALGSPNNLLRSRPLPPS